METGVIPIFPRVTHRQGVKTPLQMGNLQGFARKNTILGESYKNDRRLTENRLKMQLCGENPAVPPLGIYRKGALPAQLIGQGDFLPLPGLV